MNKLVVLLVILLVVSCKSMGPREIRKHSVVKETSVDARTAYKRALVVMAKRFNDSNSAIKVKDESDARIVAKGRIVNCFSNISTDFDIDFKAKDKKARVMFEDIEAFTLEQDGRKAFQWGPKDSDDVNEIASSCLNSVADEIFSAVGASDDF